MRHPLSAFAAPGWRRWSWLGLMLGASLALTLGFACAVPFAAFGAIAALTLSRRDALLLTLALWLVNQTIGYTVLHYPLDGSSLVWGGVIGGVALLTTAAAQAANRRPGVVAAAASSFAAAFVVYEGSLYLVSAAVLGGAEIYTLPTILRILEINAASFAVLLASAVLAATLAPRRQMIGQAAHAGD